MGICNLVDVCANTRKHRMIHKCIYMKKTSCTDEQKNLLIVTLDKRIKKVVINSKVDKAMLQGSDHYALYTYENKDV